MATLDDEIVSRLDQLREEIQRRMEERQVNASGKTSASIRIVQGSGHIQLVGGNKDTAPFESLRYGMPPTYVPLSVLYKWAETKKGRYGWFSDANLWAVAKGTQRNIRQGGTRRYKNNDNYIYAEPTAEAVEDLKVIIRQSVNAQITGILNGL